MVIVARPEFDKSENTTGSTEDTKVNIEAGDEVPLPKERRHVDVLKQEGKRKRNSTRIPKARRRGYTQQKGKKRSSLHLRDIFNE